MSGWFERWAKHAAAATPDTTPTTHPVRSRRDFLKTAGIVGGVAWSVPVLQTVLAPAASASAGTPLGNPCNDLGTCNGGNAYCNGATCGGVGAICPGSVCVSGVECSGRTGSAETCGGPGATCGGANDDAADGLCTSGNCSKKKNGVCGGKNAACPGGSSQENANLMCADGFECDKWDDKNPDKAKCKKIGAVAASHR